MAGSEKTQEEKGDEETDEEVNNNQTPPEPTDSQIKEYVKNTARAISDMRDRPVLYLLYPSYGMIQSNHATEVYDIFLKEGEIDNLDVIIHSTGGDLHEAYDIIKLCRSYTQNDGEVSVFVPVQAMSAATLIALGDDKTILSEIGKLGPLDPQIPHPVMGSYMPVRSVTDIPRVLEKGLSAGEYGIPIEIVGDSIIKPIAEQVDPYFLAEHDRTADLAREYGQKVLKERNVPETHAERCLDYLVEYPTHGYSVDLLEIESTPDLRSAIDAQSVKNLLSGAEIEQSLILIMNIFSYWDVKHIRRNEPRSSPWIKLVRPTKGLRQQEIREEYDQAEDPDTGDTERDNEAENNE